VIAFLSASWFEKAGELAAGTLTPRPGVSCRLQYEAASTRWAQVVEDGSITRWEQGELQSADLEIRWNIDDAYRILHRGISGTEALAATTVVDGDYVGPPSPMDLGQQAELARLPRLPGATLDVQYEHAAGPFGHVSFIISFVDGQVASMRFGRLDDRDALVEVPYLVMALVRRGDLSIYEAIERGRVEGQVGPLALLAGLTESPELHAAELACGRSGLALGQLGEATAVAGFETAMQELAGMTEMP
jgi:hypothetical protein